MPCAGISAYSVSQIRHKLLGVAKTAFANVEPLGLSAYEIFRVRRRVPRLDLDDSQDDIQHIGLGRSLFGHCCCVLQSSRRRRRRRRGRCTGGHVVTG
jgi:hypothetical protein